MKPNVMEKVLSCRQVPSLPAVALSVIELTQRDDLKIRDLARLIASDQGLAGKILRTVNSSFYGLRQNCSSIDQAIVLLGLSAVKTLALGFSLVSVISDGSDDAFDQEDYWCRAVLTGAAARQFAKHAGIGYEEECFLGGLLQDIGMVALYCTLGPDYSRILAMAGGDHRKLAKQELDALDVQHPEVGARLAERWKLPDELVLPIRFHERPTAAPVNHLRIVQAVGLGNIAADVLTSEPPSAALRRLYTRAEQWFGQTPLVCDEVLTSLGPTCDELARLLDVSMGGSIDSERVLKEARKAILDAPLGPGGDPCTPAAETDCPDSLTYPEDFDELTGLYSRRCMDRSAITAYEKVCAGGPPMSVMVVHVDGMDDIRRRYADEAAEATLIAVAGRMTSALRESCGIVCRHDEAGLSAVWSGSGLRDTLALAERVRGAIADTPIDLIAGRDAPPHIRITVSIGVASVEPATLTRYDSSGDLLHAAERAAAASSAGGNRVLAHNPMAAAA